MSSSSNARFYTRRLQSTEIRLLSFNWDVPGEPIEVSTDIFSLDSAPRYSAVSYVWGDPSITTEIYLNGLPLAATTNLGAALRALRRLNDFDYLWIDALCIDQSNDDEKSEQVPLMSYIYTSADRVYCWLGEERDNSDLAFELIEHWRTAIRRTPGSHEFYHFSDSWPRYFSQNSSSLLKLCPATSWEALYLLFQRPYFRRIWIIQEYYLPEDARLVCGEKSFEKYELAKLIAIWKALLRYEPAVQPAAQLIEKCDLSFFDKNFTSYTPNDVDSYGLKRFANHFMSVFLATYRFQATDPRDKIFGLLGLFPVDQSLIRPDYSRNIMSVYVDVMMKMIHATNRLDLLALSGTFSKSIPSGPEIPGRPSWVLDFSNIGQDFSKYWEYLTTLQLRACGKGVYSSVGSGVPIPTVRENRLRVCGVICDHILAIFNDRVAEHNEEDGEDNGEDHSKGAEDGYNDRMEDDEEEEEEEEEENDVEDDEEENEEDDDEKDDRDESGENNDEEDDEEENEEDDDEKDDRDDSGKNNDEKDDDGKDGDGKDDATSNDSDWNAKRQYNADIDRKDDYKQLWRRYLFIVRHQKHLMIQYKGAWRRAFCYCLTRFRPHGRDEKPMFPSKHCEGGHVVSFLCTLVGFKLAMQKASIMYGADLSRDTYGTHGKFSLETKRSKYAALVRELRYWAGDNKEHKFHDLLSCPDQFVKQSSKLIFKRLWRLGLQEFRRDLHTFWERYQEVYDNRVLFVTSRGYVGLGPVGSSVGDAVTVMAGCSVPLILRPSAATFKLIGDGYVWGMMDGEMFKEVDKGKMTLEQLIIE